MKRRLISLLMFLTLVGCDLPRTTRYDGDYYPRERYYPIYDETRRSSITQPSPAPLQPNNNYYYYNFDLENKPNRNNHNVVKQKDCYIEDIEFKEIPVLNIKEIEKAKSPEEKAEKLANYIAKLKRHLIEMRRHARDHIERHRQNCQD